MKRRTIVKSLQLAGCLISALYTCTSSADWSQKHPYGGYNKGYGDFPPIDIDQQLSGAIDKKDAAKEQPQAVEKTETKVVQQPATVTTNTQNTTAQAPQQAVQQQAVQQPVYGGYYQYNQPYAYYGAQPYYNRSTGYGPWNNGRYGYGGPWNNRGYGFSGPWNNNGSSFSMPWGNNRSGFTPWGNGGSWSWV